MKRALVTGGSGGIGSAICRRLARDGLHVFVHGHQNAGKAEALAGEIRRDGGSAEALTFDVTNFDACHRTLSTLAEAGPIQVLVNNAGTHSDAPLAGMSVEQWRQVIDVSLNGFFNVTRPLLMPMIRERWGRVVTISSVLGVIGNRGQSNYAAAKAGLHGATKSLAAELATRGVTANVVAPGIIGAGMGEIYAPEMIKTFVPMKRAGTADEVASLVAYLASEDAAYITGQVICVSGGVG
jgi:3-oxoacyl-[acyl-carrier protein] reductase